jgi:cell division protein FtsW (lipid II flippase)
VRLLLLGASAALVGIGIATIYAVGHPAEPSPAAQAAELGHFWKKQLIFAAAGVAAFIVVNLINYRRLGAAGYWIYGLVLGLLALLLVGRYLVKLPFVPEIRGTHRWIAFSIAGWELPSVQPSEICKVAYILAMAWYLRYRSNYAGMKALIGPFALTVLPMVLILLEPDLGTVMLMMPILFVMLFVAGAKVRHLLVIVLLAVLVSPLMWWKMKPYQRIRISSVLLQNESVRQMAEQYPVLGEILVGERFSERQWNQRWGYHLMRSKFAVAAGGTTGYGFGRGPFVKYDFLPDRQNDFIFAAIAHQWGFWGCLALFGLYGLVIGAGLEIAVHNTDPFGRLLAVGIVAMFAVEVIVNVSMTMGLMPITGLTLPLVSYGGSSLLVSMMAVGLLNNVGRCRPFGMAREVPGRPLLSFILRKP